MSIKYDPLLGRLRTTDIETAASIGLGNVDNTSDADKPVSTAQQAALDGKQYKAFVTVGFADADYICDGTDDHVQIQAAVDAVNTAGGGVVFVKSGDYEFDTTPVSLKSNVYIKGAGMSTVLHRKSDSVLTRLFNSPNEDLANFGISDLVIDFQASAITVSNNAISFGSDTYSTSHVYLENIVFKNVSKMAIFFYKTTFLYARNIKIESFIKNIGADGFNLTASSDCFFENFSFQTGDDGLVMRECERVFVKTFSRSGAAAGACVRVSSEETGCHDIVVDGVMDVDGQSSNVANAFSINTSGSATQTHPLYNIIASNIVAHSVYSAVSINSSAPSLQDGITYPLNNISITDFVAKDCFQGLRINPTSAFLVKGLKISNGYIDSSTDHALLLTSARDALFENIRIFNGAKRGLTMPVTQLTGKNFIENVAFSKCDFSKNTTIGANIGIFGTTPEAWQSEVSFTNCRFNDNGEDGLNSTASQLRVKDCVFKGNTLDGIKITNGSSTVDTFLENIRVEDNGGWGLRIVSGTTINIKSPRFADNVSGTISGTPKSLIQDSTTPTISTGTTVPATTPTKVGDTFVDTTNGNIYIAKGIASSADWVQQHTQRLRSITAARTLDATDHVISADGTFNVTLPTAVGITGRQYKIKNIGTGTITVATTSSQTIDGVATYELVAQYESVTVVSNNANWLII